jgi:hypothetical protein
MGSLANSRDSALGTTSGAAIARGGSGAIAARGSSPTGWAIPTGVTPLAAGLIGAIGLLVYLDRRVVFKS